jgi:uncharacterized membrane-anchored protein
MNGQYFYTKLGRQMNKEWGRSNYKHAREMRNFYATKKGRRELRREEALKVEQEMREQESLRAKYSHIPHVYPSDEQ